MYKVIDLGCDFPQTGEPRVRLLDSGLVKTASTEIQDFWAQLTPSDSCAYLWVIGVSAVEYYGCNRNGDAFLESELKRTHHHFTDTAHIFLHHVNRDPNKSIGKPIFSWYNDDMHRVELILEIRKGAEGADAIVDKIRRGEQLYVSMGCSVEVDRCSICGHESKTRAQYCDHLRYNMKKILPDGRQVFAYNPNPKFFDISIVRKPADPTAFALDKIASYNEGGDYCQKTITSAELGEQAIDLMQKRAAISKLSDIFKSIDAVVADSKLPEEIKERCDRELYHQGFMDAMRVMHEHGFENLGNTILDHDMLNKDGVSPCGLLKILASHNAPLSISDAAWMAAKHFMTDSPSESLIGNIVNAIPSVLPLLAKRPSAISELVEPILNDYRGENLDGILDHYSEPLRIRVVIVRKMPIVKTAETVYNEPVFPDDTGVAYGSLPSTILPRYKKLHFKTQDGRIFETTPEALGILTKGGFPQNLLTTKGLGATLAAASLLSLIAAPSVFGAAGLVGGTLLATGKDPQMIKSMEGVEVPISTLMQSYKRQVTQPVAVMQKSAGWGTNLAAGVGAMIPAGLAVDYALNQRRYGQGYERICYQTTYCHTMIKKKRFVEPRKICNVLRQKSLAF